MMAAKREQIIQNGSLKENNLLHRIWHLPVVSSAFSGLQKMYSTAKDAHPLVASICSIYEQGLWSASSLAARSMKPVVQKLKPRFAAVNARACRCLDHLEQKIPALNQPVEKVTSDLKESILTHRRSAMDSATGTLDRALELAAKSYKRSKISPRDATEYAKSSRVGQLAEGGINAMTSRLQKLVNFFLPRTEHKSENASNEISSKSTFGKISTLAAHVPQQVYQQATEIIQRTKDKGWELAVWIPDVGGLGKQSAAKVLYLLSEAWNRTSGWLHKQLGRGLEEKEKRTAGDKSSKPVQNGTFVQNLQAASLAIVLSVRKAPFIIWNLLGQVLQVSPRASGSGAGAEVDMLKGTLHSLTSSLLGTLATCIPFLKALEKEAETTSAAHSESGRGEEEEEEPEEKGIPYYLLGSRRSSRGHHPLFFLNLDDPLPSGQAPSRRHSKAFEAEYTMCHRSAFSPYKEANSKRRMSEGMCRPSTEVLCTRAHYRGLISDASKKD